ncbi:Serine/threonine protein kinase [Sinosporangium album]|uniref:non-specific serine/threonine protein kinase n=1 Tax=Sinosporangium album TaxID=504805 RepID=A0A1G8I6P7_9ACTN|nr:serine/threonine-protein kinase [Sinosporangium album]SDI14260.1 Serine/threonine protein kinase [Sinosporangium album]
MDSAPLVGERYQVKSQLNRGGEQVWRAYDLRLRRDVAIKEIRTSSAAGGAGPREARRQALREARSAGRLSHPAIITVHDLVEEGGRLWIVTELIEGLSLRDTVLHVGPLPPRWTAWIGFQLLGALRHAHGLGVFHQAVSPTTILLTGNRVVLSDFGLAGLGRDGLSPAAAVRPAPAYIAPESFAAETPTAAADLWSFGASLYFAVEGHPPFTGADVITVLSGIKSGPRPPEKAGPLWPVLEALLQSDPGRRLTTDRAVTLLGELLREAGVSVEPYRLPAVPPSAFTS